VEARTLLQHRGRRPDQRRRQESIFPTAPSGKLRTGQGANPQVRLIEALARASGVPPVFFEDVDDKRAGLLREQVELLALIRDTGTGNTDAQLRTLLGLTGTVFQSVIDLIKQVGLDKQ